MKELFFVKAILIIPKPIKLLNLAKFNFSEDSIIPDFLQVLHQLHMVTNLNKENGGNRKYI